MLHSPDRPRFPALPYPFFVIMKVRAVRLFAPILPTRAIAKNASLPVTPVTLARKALADRRLKRDHPPVTPGHSAVTPVTLAAARAGST
jgi:hypothetical protein